VRYDPRPPELAGERVAITDQEVGANRHRGALVERQRKGLRLVAPVGDQPLRQPVGQRCGERDPGGGLAFGCDRVVDPGDRVPVELARYRRGARGLDQPLEHEQREQALEIPRCALGLAAACERRVDATEMTHEAVQRLTDEPPIVRSDPRLLAECRREPIGHKAPVHPGALPQLEHQRAQTAAIDNLGCELLVRDAIEIGQSASYIPDELFRTTCAASHATRRGAFRATKGHRNGPKITLKTLGPGR
jgi:hypothetical protein